MTETMKLADFIALNGLTMTSKRTERNVNMNADMDHWKVTIRHLKSRMTITFSQGYGHHGAEPQLADVLDCLASDASGVENARSFEEWCSEYGFDADSRKAMSTYKACEREVARLKALLGDELYRQLLYGVERE